MMTPEEVVMMEADRADWLERVARLIYESETMGEDLPGDFGPVLRGVLEYWHQGMREAQ